MHTVGLLIVYLIKFHGFIDATRTFYEEITGADGMTINAESMQRTSLIHKSFHQCSMKETCNYVIKDTTNGSFSQFNSEDELPQNKTGLRIWKKIYLDPLKDCRDAYNRGNKHDGLFEIKIPVIGLSKVRCDMTTTPGGWVVFQRRVDTTVGFYRTWNDYKEGFGDLSGNFWLGLEKLHQLAAPGKGATLRVDLKHMDLPGEIMYAEYSLFEISNETDGYRLRIDGFSGNVRDSLKYHNEMKFSTKDHDLDLSNGNCATYYQGAFWFRNCYNAHLNGIFPPDGAQNNKYISWHGAITKNGRIIFSEMKTRI